MLCDHRKKRPSCPLLSSVSAPPSPATLDNAESQKVAESLCCETPEQAGMFVPSIYGGSGIHTRKHAPGCAVVDDILTGTPPGSPVLLTGVPGEKGPTTRERMQIYEAEAAPTARDRVPRLWPPPVLSLLNQGLDTMRSQPQRDCALAVFEQIASGELALYLLIQLENKGFEDKDSVYLILQHLGEKAVPTAIQRLNIAGTIHSRKALATALARIGKAGSAIIAGRVK